MYYLSTILDNLFTGDATNPSPLEIIVAVAASLILNLIVAALYKKTYRGKNYSQDYVHTLVIIGTVVTIIILIVKGEGGGQIAFGMFAAFSIIRFRKNLTQARDLGFIFISMATGLTVGALTLDKLWLVVVVLAIVLSVVYVMSMADLFAPTRVSHKLRVRVTNDINYDECFNEIFAKYIEDYDLTSVESSQAGMMTELLYAVTLKKDMKLIDFMEHMQVASGNNHIILTRMKGNDLGV